MYPFWTIIVLCALLALGSSFREGILLSRIPKGHPDRGMYWFNVFFLLCVAMTILYLGLAVDSGRCTFERMIAIPPAARYAVERNRLGADTTWVYVVRASQDEVRAFYISYAAASKVPLVLDDEDASRLLFILPSGELFLTLTPEGERTFLYFSREGKWQTVTRRTDSQAVELQKE